MKRAREIAIDYIGVIPKHITDMLTQEIKDYAEQCVKDHLSRAAENARTRTNDESTSIIVDRESITNIDVELP